MVVNKYWLRPMYLNAFREAVDYFAKCFNERVRPAFGNLDEEADKVQQDTYERLGSVAGPESDDDADIADLAFHTGVDHYIMATGIVQGVTNMFTTGLHHLFEQQFLAFHRKELLLPKEEDNTDLLKVGIATERLQQQYGIDVGKFNSWDKITELRHVANCVKHGDGLSCGQLRKLRPDLFVPPSLKDEYAKGLSGASHQVIQPMAGQDLFISPEEFNKYADEVKRFWDEFGKAFDLYEYKQSETDSK